MTVSLLAVLVIAWLSAACVHCQTSDGLFIATSNDILFKNGNDVPVSVHHTTNGRIVGLTFDHEDSLLFWSNIDIDSKGIFRASVGDHGTLTNIQHIVSKDVDEINGLSIDWVSKHLYWTDGGKRSIELSDYNGENRRVLNIQGLVIPRGIYVDPIQMWLYWNDQIEGGIGKCRLDGSDVEFNKHAGIQWPNQMVWDSSQGRLYFVDSKSKALQYYNNGNVVLVANFTSQVDGNNIFGLAVKNNNAYVSVWNSGQLLKVDLSSRSVDVLHDGLTQTAMFSLLYWTAQPEGNHVCGSNQHGCDALCLPTGGGNNDKRCACPSFGGKILYDNQSCKEPQNILLYTSGDLGEVAFHTTDQRFDSSDRYLVARSLRPVAVHYNPSTKTVYWSDVTERTIRSANLDGSEAHVFLSYNHSIGVVDGLVVDPALNLLYYSNMGFVEVDGATYSWHKIESVSLSDVFERRVIIDTVERPRGLTTAHGKLFYTDWGSQASVSSSEKDGSAPNVLQGGLDNPNGVYVEGSDIFVIDAHQKAHSTDATRTPASLYLLDNDGNNEIRTVDVPPSTTLQTPFGITGDAHTLFVSDWGHNAILEIKVDPQTKTVTSSKVLIANIPSPMGLVYTPVTTTGVQVRCTATSCEDYEVCLASSSENPSCECNSYDPRVNREQECSVPEDFLLFGDLNGIRMVAIGTDDNSIYTLVEGGPYFSNFAGLAYNPTSKTIFFSDVNQRAIFKYDMNTLTSSLFYEYNAIMDGLLVAEGRLFWTDYLRGSIGSISLSGDIDSYRNEISDLRQPRGLQYHDGNLYWTEWGEGPRVARARLGSSSTTTLVSKGLEWPNALFLDVNNDKMYIGDGKTKSITRCDLNGADCSVLDNINPAPEHIYGLWVSYPYLYLSDWDRGSISIVDLDSGSSTVLADDLMRPTQMAINFDGTPACPSNHGCEEICVPFPGSFKCACNAGRILESDGKRCKAARKLWLKVEASECSETCGSNAQCARRTGTNEYACQCNAGYSGDSCQACGSDMYKSAIGPQECADCPAGTLSTPGRGSCQCSNSMYWNWWSERCVATTAPKPGSCPTSSAFQPNCSSQDACSNDGACEGAMKCCDQSTCTQKCFDPVDLPQCVYNGVVYDVGEVFQPNTCTSCHCTNDRSAGNLRFGGAECDVENCPPLTCKTILYAGDCCPTCDTTNISPIEALKFVNCPIDKEVVSLEPDQRYHINEVTRTLQVTDRRNLKRAITFKQTPVKNVLHWKRNGVTQTFVVTASALNLDGQMDTATCTYHIIVNDYQKPKIACPNDQIKMTSTDKADGTWLRPIASDNIRVVYLESTPRQFSEFSIGDHIIHYVAKDASGNTANCSFHFIVKHQDLKECPELPHIQNGNINCTWTNTVYLCVLTCDTGFTRSSNAHSNHQCAGTTWVPDFPPSAATTTCLRQIPFKLRSHLLIKYSGGCSPTIDLEYTKFVLEEKLRMYLQDGDSDTINAEVFVTGCGMDARMKRGTDVMDIEIILTSEYTTQSEQESRSETIEEVLKRIKDDIQRGSLTFELSDDEGVRQIDNHNSGLVLSGGVVENGKCNAGELEVEGGCLKCPSGTKQEGSDCINCPSATYQELEGQTQCSECPAGSTGSTREGLYAQEQCETSPPSTGSNQTKIIIAVAIGVGVVIIIIIIIVVIAVSRHIRKSPVKEDDRQDRRIEIENKSFEVYDEIDHKPVDVYDEIGIQPKHYEQPNRTSRPVDDQNDYANLSAGPTA